MAGSVPQFVLDDLDEPTIKRYLSDADFRRSLFENPAEFNERENLGFSTETIEWINERIGHHGLQRLLAELPDEVSPM
ncbi:MAG TPA: hypothetical protein VFV02_09375 [Acidimicrobiales bacterium]|nr:hypothetical protein [Acidimicrobiales bacterium]